MDISTEQYITLFCEGDGHIGLYGPAHIARIVFGQKKSRRDILEDFNGPSYYDQNKDKVLAYKHSRRDAIAQYDRNKCEQRRQVREYLKLHLEVEAMYKQ